MLEKFFNLKLFQHDQDVFELEQLKDAENRDQTSDVTIPELEAQLEKQAAANIGQPEEEASIHSEEKIPIKVLIINFLKKISKIIK